MFGKPLHDVEYSDIVRFLESGVREGMVLEFKRDFPADLEKPLAAFANTYGGIVLIGVTETVSGAAALPVGGVELKPGLRERVIQKALDAIHPPLLPEVHVVEFRSDPSLDEPDRAIVVVSVAESVDAPHAVAERTVIYLRSDNVSSRFVRKAKVGEIEWLLNKRQKSLDLKQSLISRALDRANALRPARHGRNRIMRYWRDGDMTLILAPAHPHNPLLDTREWFNAVNASQVPFESAPMSMPRGRVQRISGGLFFDDEYSYSEYQAHGMIFHQFDYWWDYIAQNTFPQVRQLYPDATAALLTSAFANAVKIYQKANYAGIVEFSFKATGLAGAFFAGPRRTHLDIAHLAESEVELKRAFTVEQLASSVLETAMDCQRELYWAFGFDAPDKWIIEDFQSR